MLLNQSWSSNDLFSPSFRLSDSKILKSKAVGPCRLLLLAEGLVKSASSMFIAPSERFLGLMGGTSVSRPPLLLFSCLVCAVFQLVICSSLCLDMFSLSSSTKKSISSSISADRLFRKPCSQCDVSFDSVSIRFDGLFGEVLVRSELIVCAVLRRVGLCILLACVERVACGDAIVWKPRKLSDADFRDGDKGDG